MPLHSAVFTSGSPASDILDTSGSSAERTEPVTASAFTWPPLTSGTVGGPSAIVSKVCPPTTETSDSPLLLYGIGCPGAPVLSLNNSVAIVNAGDDVA